MLKDLVQNGTRLEENFDALLEVVNKINSDFDKVNVIKIFLRNKHLKVTIPVD